MQRTIGVTRLTVSAQNAKCKSWLISPKGNYVVTAELNGETVSQKILKNKHKEIVFSDNLFYR